MPASRPDERSIFLRALEITSPDERAAFLEAAYGSDQSLRAAVEALLHAHESPQGLLDVAGVAPATTAEPAADHAGAVIGPYTLIQAIGEGGMGTVYMAQQTEPVRRLVALKVVKPGMDSKPVVARFEAERQALALMDHPHIAKVFDGGTTDSGRPYFVMELVKGPPLTKYCDEQRLTPRQRLELFVPVCQAVQHAHQKGIIHRDLKPSNVLVALYDGRPVPKVIDFGIAKATGPQLTEHTLVTGFGAVVGTLEYMSPEQAELNQLDIDTRSDIYSLGVLLYELLTGTTPLEKNRLKAAAMLEVLRLIREEEPQRPSTRLSTTQELPAIAANRGVEPKKLSGLVRGELDWIVMKALEKDRNRRYETANGFAMDVQRYLADEPVQACPPSAGYRLRKFARRNKGPVLAASVILLCLLAGILGTSAGLVWALRERDAKANALSAETKAKQIEVQAREIAMTVLRSLTEDVVQERLARKEDRLSEADLVFFRDFLKQYQQFADLPGDEAEQRALRAEGHYRVACMRDILGEEKEAESSHREATALFRQLAADFPTRPEFRDDLAASQHNLGSLLRKTGRLKEAESAYLEALGLRRQLVADFPTRPEFRSQVAGSQHNLGGLFHETGRLKWAEAAYAEALALFEQLVADFPARPEFRHDLAGIQINLGKLYFKTSRLPEAEAAHGAAVALYKQLAADFPGDNKYRRKLGLAHNNLAILFRKTGRPKEAEAAFAEALTLRKQLAADFPGQPEFRDDLADSHDSLGILLRGTGRMKEAETAYADALALRKQLVADFRTRPEFRSVLALSHTHMGNLFRDTGRPKEAEAAHTEALALRKQLARDFPRRYEFRDDLADSHLCLGVLFCNAHRYKEAEAAYREGLAIYEQLVKDFPTHPEFRQDLASSHNNLAVLLNDTGRLKEAEAAHTEALALRKQFAKDIPARPELRRDVAESYNNLGVVLQKAGRPKEAAAAYTDAVAVLRQLVAEFSDRPDLQDRLAMSYANLARLSAAARDFKAANNYLDQAAPHLELALKANPRHPGYRLSKRNNLVAGILVKAGLGDQAAAKQLAESLRDLAGDPGVNAYDAACALALCLPIVQKDEQSPQEERDKRVRFYGDEALKLLRDAVAKGFKEAAHMKRDTDLDPLRQREDFKKLMAELEAGKKKEK